MDPEVLLGDIEAPRAATRRPLDGSSTAWVDSWTAIGTELQSKCRSACASVGNYLALISYIICHLRNRMIPREAFPAHEIEEAAGLLFAPPNRKCQIIMIITVTGERRKLEP